MDCVAELIVRVVILGCAAMVVAYLADEGWNPARPGGRIDGRTRLRIGAPCGAPSGARSIGTGDDYFHFLGPECRRVAMGAGRARLLSQYLSRAYQGRLLPRKIFPMSASRSTHFRNQEQSD
jgi:hypothetical protein